MVGAMSRITLRVPGLRKARRGSTRAKRKPALRTKGSWTRAWRRPPAATEAAMARAGLGMKGERAMGRRMKQRLKRMGAKPAGAKTLTELRMPWKKAAKETK